MAGADPTVKLSALWPEISAALPDEWRQPPDGVQQITGRAWKVSLPRGRALALKFAEDAAALGREAAVLGFLRRHDCSVVRVVGWGPGWLATEWAGDDTLDDLLQRGGAVDASKLAAAVRRVSDALEEAARPVEAAVNALASDLARWVDALPGTLEWLGVGGCDEALRQTLERALACAARPGSLDYTARNVVVTPDGPVLLDFGATGFDWDERRLAQYALSAGAGVPDGEFRSALSPMTFDGSWDAGGIDAHEAILLLIAAEHLRQVERGVAHAERGASWSNVAQRKAGLRRLLARSLAPSGPAAWLRAAFEA